MCDTPNRNVLMSFPTSPIPKRVPCIACSAKISQEAATRNDGRCSACKKGDRLPTGKLPLPPPVRPSRLYLRTLFERLTDRESIYDVGHICLSFLADSIPASVSKFQAAYDLNLALGNGFSGIFSAHSGIIYLVDGVKAFHEMGDEVIAAPGDEVIACFRGAGVFGDGEDMLNQYYKLEWDAEEVLRSAISEIDERCMSAIWKNWSHTESCLINWRGIMLREIE